jgi:hypothetical protein
MGYINNALANIMLAARDRDEGAGWFQILVFVVVAVVYALGGILKSRSARIKQENQEPPAVPKHKPPLGGAGPRRSTAAEIRRPSDSALPRRQYQPRVHASAGAILRSESLAPRLPETREQVLPAPDVQSPGPAIFPSTVLLDESIECISTPLKSLYEEPMAAAAEESEPAYLPEILSDYADPDQLRTAILHYEILGKPIALRDPSQQVIGP